MPYRDRMRCHRARSSRPTRARSLTDIDTLLAAHGRTQTNVGEATNGALSLRLAR
jgi:hypothetical protein